MHDFWFCNPAKIILGHNKVDEIGNVIKGFGENVLFVFGKGSIKENGLYQQIKDRLNDAGLGAIDHGGVQSNPRISHVAEGITLARQHRIDCVLAVGGGSVIDAAKVIAFGAVTDRDVWSFFTDRVKPEKALPIFTVPTLAGSGSEMNAGAVLTNEHTGQKLAMGAPCLVPKVSILDPNLTLTAPRNYTFYGLIDAFSHVMESYFNGENIEVPVQDRIAEGIFVSLIEISRRLLIDLFNYEYRANAMWAACMAHNGLLTAGRGRVTYEIHCLAHVLGALFDVPHGAAISVVMPAWLTFRLNQKLSKIAQFAIRVMGLDNHLDQNELTRIGIAEFKSWLTSVSGPVSLTELGIEGDAIPAIVDNLATAVSSGGMRDIDRRDLDEIVQLMF